MNIQFIVHNHKQYFKYLYNGSKLIAFHRHNFIQKQMETKVSNPK